MKQVEMEGWGSLGELPGVLESIGAKKIFLVTGKTSYAGSGARKILDELLHPYVVTRFCDFSAERDPDEIARGAELLRSIEFDAVVAVGGGTVIDTAKLISILTANKGDVRKYIKRDLPLESKGLPLVAVPTTAGSGSESTHFAVVYMDKIKYSVAHEYMLPDYCIVDPSLTMTLPADVTASTGLDALAQAVESYWSINSTAESRGYSRRALELAAGHLRSAATRPDKKSRQAMAEASHLSGKAINIAKTTVAHAVSYYFTAHHNVPHGHAVALTLGSFIRFNSMVGAEDVADERGLDHVKGCIGEILRILGAESGDEGAGVIENLMQELGLETDIGKLGLSGKEEVDRLVGSINVERLKNNPRKIEPQDIPGIIGAR
ncbi:MAG: phosphonoacetaldehyde reductase [Candidatus Eisenbacteria bacterium]